MKDGVSSVGGCPTSQELSSELALSAISEMFCEVEVLRGRHPGGTFRKSTIGDMTVLYESARAGRITSSRSNRIIRRSREDSFILCRALRGVASVYQEGREAHLANGEMVLIDSRRRYEATIADQAEMICLKIRRPSIESRIVDYGRYLAIALKTDTGLGYVLGNMLKASVETSHCMTVSDGRRFEASFIDMMGSTFRGQVDDGIDVVGHSHRLFSRVREYIADHLANGSLGPAMISREMGISERYLRKMFAARGITLMGCIRAERLERCRKAILEGTGDYASLADIAYAHGFNDISSFNRSFKAAFGVTPGDVRKSSRAGAMLAHGRAQQSRPA